MERPVIILGGGIWGSLLAYRLKEALPHIPFKLYEASSVLGNNKSCSFRESDCAESMRWLRPLVSHSWNEHHMKFRKIEKKIAHPYHLIDANHLHEKVSTFLGPETLKLNNKISAELALKEASFVIDARNICFYQKTAHRHTYSVEVELEERHHVSFPNVLSIGDSTSELQYMQVFPLGPNRLLINDFRHTTSSELDMEERRESLIRNLNERSWVIKTVIKENFSVSEIPTTAPRFRQDGRVINLAGIFHDMNGCSLPMATKLIDRMVRTSFRFGELKEVVTTFRNEIERDRQFLRFLNRLLLERKQYQLFDSIYNQSYKLIERFSQGKVKILDRYRILLKDFTALRLIPLKVSKKYT